MNREARTSNGRSPSAGTLIAGAVAAAAAAYGTMVALTWARYGRPTPPQPDEADPLLDRFMPSYDIVERHSIAVDAPAAVTLAAARNQDLAASAVIRGIFRLRELAMRSSPQERRSARGLLDEVQALGWRVLAETPDREIVVGAVTKPWEADVVFRRLAADEFADFCEPDYIKIIWSLRADPIGPYSSIFRTETRALPTDDRARGKFRRYWSFVAPGVSMIRHLMLRPMKADAERRAVMMPPAFEITEQDVS